MRYYEMPIPMYDNRGAPMQEAHGRFAATIKTMAGGYTASDAWGVMGEQEEPVRVYRFALEDPDAREVVMLSARQAFPDQSSFFIAHVGNAFLLHGAVAKTSCVACKQQIDPARVQRLAGDGGPVQDFAAQTDAEPTVFPNGVEGWEGGGARAEPPGFDNLHETGNPSRAALAGAGQARAMQDGGQPRSGMKRSAIGVEVVSLAQAFADSVDDDK